MKQFAIAALTTIYAGKIRSPGRDGKQCLLTIEILKLEDDHNNHR
jgi:hypothetical protein